MRRRLALVLLLAIACTAAQCPAPRLRVLSPPDGGRVTWKPLFLEIDRHVYVSEASLVLELNGVDVTDQLVFDPPFAARVRATALDVWATGLVVQGPNQLVLSAGGLQATSSFIAEGDPHADALVSFTPGSGAGFGQGDLPDIVLGAPQGLGLLEGSLDVLALGQGGEVVLEFVDNAIVDEPGVDFLVFENAFLSLVFGFTSEPFAEPGRVAVSQDGVVWHEFAACQTAPVEPPRFPGCAGVYPTFSDALDPATPHASIPTATPIGDLVGVPQAQLALPEGAGGDGFDLADVGLAWARFVRIQDVGPALGQAGTVGFDLDAVSAVNSVPGTDADRNGVPDAVE